MGEPVLRTERESQTMADQSLKPCPFCGGKAIYVTKQGMATYTSGYASCANVNCMKDEYIFLVNQWNTRPIEDRLHGELAKVYLDLLRYSHEISKLTSQLDIAVRGLGHYANDNNWFKTPTLTEWTLNPNAPLLAKNALAEIAGKNEQ